MDPTFAPGYKGPSLRSPKKKSHHFLKVKRQHGNIGQDESSRDTELKQNEREQSPVSSLESLSTSSEGGTSDFTSQSQLASSQYIGSSSRRRGEETNGDSERSDYVSRNFSSSGMDTEMPLGGPADLDEVPLGISRQATTLEEYRFPLHRFKRVMDCPDKIPVVMVACGSFSPITNLHLRMFEMAVDKLSEDGLMEIMGGFYSPVSDRYMKPGLAAATHRVRMCELACERTSTWLSVDSWETLQPVYTPTARVLDHFDEEINGKLNGVRTPSGEYRRVKVMLLAGGDLIESMGEPGVWSDEDLHHIIGKHGCLIVERTGTDVMTFLLSHDILYQHRKNIVLIKQLIYNDISSTKVR